MFSQFLVFFYVDHSLPLETVAAGLSCNLKSRNPIHHRAVEPCGGRERPRQGQKAIDNRRQSVTMPTTVEMPWLSIADVDRVSGICQFMPILNSNLSVGSGFIFLDLVVSRALSIYTSGFRVLPFKIVDNLHASNSSNLTNSTFSSTDWSNKVKKGK